MKQYPKDYTERTLTEAVKKNLNRKRPSIDSVTMIDGVPMFTWLELNVNELCNRTCIFCPRSSTYPNQNIHMDIETANKVAVELFELDFKGTVNISGTGESLLTKHLVDIVFEFGSRNIPIEVVTNGDKLKEDYIKRLYSAGLSQIVVSMYDGPEQTDYFNDLFAKCNIDKKLYTLRDRWYDEDADYGLIYTNRAGFLGDDLPSPEDRHCYYPSYSMYIDWNGDALLCCQDMYNRTIILGNIKDQSLLEIWKSKKLNEYRKKLSSGDRDISPCNNCNANGMVFGENHSDEWKKIFSK